MSSLKLFLRLRDMHIAVLIECYLQIQSGASCKVRCLQEQLSQGPWHRGLKIKHHLLDQLAAI